jgi:site-specific DNA-cytosine methylase
MINCLELFSGTHSVGKCCESLGYNVISVDLELPADHQTDIMNFEYQQYPKDHFDLIWASPPCTYYSNLQNSWLGRKLKNGKILTKELLEEKRIESDKLIRKTFEIINYFNPEYWFVENPQRGQLKDREIMKNYPYYDVSYCMYSEWGYEKRTRIWTNKKDWNNLICDKSGSCGNMITIPSHNESKQRHLHKNNCGNYKTLQELKKYQSVLGGGTTRLDRYRIPPELIYSLLIE